MKVPIYIKRINTVLKTGSLYEKGITLEIRKETCKMYIQENIFVGPVRSEYVTYLIFVGQSGRFNETWYEDDDICI
jgi:hypothetical protein